MTSLKTSIKTITYLSDTGCLEIQGASLIHENVVIKNSIISRETTDDESDINTLYLDSFKSKNNCKSFETNSNLLDKNGKPVEIMVCDVQELHFFVPKN
ncbi:hypothetical protein [Escherichia coli]|uniref:hypothetical protein n=1 Tax=Escherichia coli TaxID=562 RepID=UPI003CED6485